MRGSLAVLAVLLLIPFGAHAQVKDADLSVRLFPSSSDLQASGKVRVGQFLTWFAVATNKGPVAVENMAVTIDVPGEIVAIPPGVATCTSWRAIRCASPFQFRGTAAIT